MSGTQAPIFGNVGCGNRAVGLARARSAAHAVWVWVWGCMSVCVCARALPQLASCAVAAGLARMLTMAPYLAEAVAVCLTVSWPLTAWASHCCATPPAPHEFAPQTCPSAAIGEGCQSQLVGWNEQMGLQPPADQADVRTRKHFVSLLHKHVYQLQLRGRLG